jgi:predicted ester cyclase
MESGGLQNAPLCDGRRYQYGAERGAAVSAQENEAVFRRWIDAYNERDRQGEADARAPSYVAHAPGVPDPLDSDAWEEFAFDVFAGAFPDLRLTIETVAAGDDAVAARIAFRGTHRGEFQGLPPTNREVAFTSVEEAALEVARQALRDRGATA